MLRTVSLVVVALSLPAAISIGCTHLPPSAYARAREAQYFSEYREVLPSIRSALERGHVILGMDREQVWTVLGEPVRRTTFTRERTIEIWLYRGHKLHQDQLRADRAELFRAVFRDGILVLLEPL